MDPVAQWTDDLLGDKKLKKTTDSQQLIVLLQKWLEQRKHIFEFVDLIVVEFQKDRKLNMMIPFLAGAFPGKVVYITKTHAHFIHCVPIGGTNSKNKQNVMMYTKMFLDKCPDSSFSPDVERHHAADACFLATAYCLHHQMHVRLVKQLNLLYWSSGKDSNCDCTTGYPKENVAGIRDGNFVLDLETLD